MDDATHLLHMCHCYPVVVKAEPQESEDTANIFDQHEVNTETSGQPLEDCLIQPKIEISTDEDLFNLQVKSEENSAFYSHFIDHPYATCQTLEGSVTEDCETTMEDNITAATSICTSEEYLIEKDPKSIEHMLTHSTEKRFQCSNCDYRCGIKNDLAKHMRSHLNEWSYACYICSNKYKHSCNFTKHMLTHTTNKLFQCSECYYRCANKQYLTKHMRSHLNEWPYACDICNCKYKHSSSLTQHMLTHLTERRGRCKKCSYRCKSSHELAIHMRIHEVEGPHICEICLLSCFSKSSLTQHMLCHSSVTSIQPEEDSIRKQERNIQTKPIIDIPVQSEVDTELTSKDNDHHTEPSQDTDPLNNSLVPPRGVLYSCELCSYQGKSKHNLAQHNRLHHSTLHKFLNNLYEYRAQPKADLNTDYRMHIVERSFICDICTVSCVSRSSLTEHKLSHSVQLKSSACDINTNGNRNFELQPRIDSREPSYSCDVCHYTSASSSALAIHKEIHKTKKYKCTQCDHTTNSKRSLTIHLRIHSREPSYACNVCNYTSASSSALAIHKKIHKTKKYKCTECDHTTNSKRFLTIHLRAHLKKLLYATMEMYKCSHCDFKSTCPRELDSHMVMHVEKNPYACDMCSYVGGASSILRQHKRKYH